MNGKVPKGNPRIAHHEFGDLAEDDKVSALLRRVFVGEGHTDPNAASAFDVAALAQRGTCWKVLVGTEVAGIVLLVDSGSPARQIAKEDEVELHLLAVSPAARGNGIGSLLVSAVVAAARSTGKRRLILSTQPAMHAAHRLYERAGFKRTAARDWQRRGRSYWAYELTL